MIWDCYFLELTTACSYTQFEPTNNGYYLAFNKVA